LIYADHRQLAPARDNRGNLVRPTSVLPKANLLFRLRNWHADQHDRRLARISLPLPSRGGKSAGFRADWLAASGGSSDRTIFELAGRNKWRAFIRV